MLIPAHCRRHKQPYCGFKKITDSRARPKGGALLVRTLVKHAADVVRNPKNHLTRYVADAIKIK